MSTEEVPDPLMWLLELSHNLGNFLLIEDYKDYGKFDRVHHWFLGELIRQLTVVLGSLYVGSKVLKREVHLDVFDKIKREFKRISR